MTLGFKTKFPWGEPTYFMQKIIASVPVPKDNPQSSPGNMFSSYAPKIHTIREGQRWKAGDLLHMATGVRTKQYHRFNEDIRELWFVKSVQRFDLKFRSPDVCILFIDKNIMYSKNAGENSTVIHGLEWMEQFVKNDGFESIDQFFRWFKEPVDNAQIIHWTDKKYE
jgi:hypothetical protein